MFILPFLLKTDLFFSGAKRCAALTSLPILLKESLESLVMTKEDYEKAEQVKLVSSFNNLSSRAILTFFTFSTVK